MIQKIKFLFQLILACIPGLFVFFLFTYFNTGEANLGLRMYARVAMFYLTLTLLGSPIAVFISDRTSSIRFLALRIVLGLSGFIFFLIH